MFNDRFGLTEAVLSGRKTQTRRVYKTPRNSYGGLEVENNCIITFDANGNEIVTRPKYEVGEVVAVAQAYKDFGAYCIDSRPITNKRYAKAEYMPHRIRITNVRVEQLQDISEDDCIAEGVIESVVMGTNGSLSEYFVEGPKHMCYGKTPREAYAVLIDLISGKGTWDSNPYMFVYDFELVD